MSDLFVHVGLPKSASTMLQQKVFPELDELHYVQDDQLQAALGIEAFEGGEDGRQAFLSQRMSAHASHGKPMLASSEHYSMPGNWLETRSIPVQQRRCRQDISDSFSKLGMNVKILLVIRRQQDWLASWYQERIKRLETRSIEQFLSSDTCMEMVSCLHYTQLLHEYEGHFGAENITVLPFEFLKLDQGRFADLLCGALGLKARQLNMPKVRSRQNALGLSARRQSNKLIKLFADGRDGKDPVEHMLFKGFKRIYSYDWILTKMFGTSKNFIELPQEIEASFARDNALLSERIGVDLSALGYSVAKVGEVRRAS